MTSKDLYRGITCLSNFTDFRLQRLHPTVIEAELGLITHHEVEPPSVGNGDDHTPIVKAVTTENGHGW